LKEPHLFDAGAAAPALGKIFDVALTLVAPVRLLTYQIPNQLFVKRAKADLHWYKTDKKK
jgi:hypothetical protein